MKQSTLKNAQHLEARARKLFTHKPQETMTPKRTLADIQAVIESLHGQPRLSDSLPEDAKVHWRYGAEIATLHQSAGPLAPSPR